MKFLTSIYQLLIKKEGKVIKQGILLDMIKILKAIIINLGKIKINKKQENLLNYQRKKRSAIYHYFQGNQIYITIITIIKLLIYLLAKIIVKLIYLKI